MRLNPNMKTRQMPDKALLSSILALLIFGWLMSFSASLAYFSSYSFFFKQTIFICAGLFAGLIILNTPISTLQKYSIPLFILSLILLTVVFFPPPIGHKEVSLESSIHQTRPQLNAISTIRFQQEQEHFHAQSRRTCADSPQQCPT